MKRDIIVVGASAGGVEALMDFVGGLPADLPAAVFVVLHTSPRSQSSLPGILNQAGPVRAEHARDGGVIEPNRIYVAPPDHHLLVEAGRTVVCHGPKENRFRPSIDALFRSAAYGYGARTIGIVLSGVLDDGTSGLWSIKRLGGLAVIQDPGDALHAEMPSRARKEVQIDHVAPAFMLGRLVGTLVGGPELATQLGA